MLWNNSYLQLENKSKYWKRIFITRAFQRKRLSWNSGLGIFYVSIQKVVWCLHQSDRLGYVSCTNQITALGYVSCTDQIVIFVLWFERCSNFNEVIGDSERAVSKMESSFRMRNIGFSLFLTCIYRAVWEMQYYWTDERYQITLRRKTFCNFK